MSFPDPRAPEFRKTTVQEKNDFVVALQAICSTETDDKNSKKKSKKIEINPMWLDCIQIKYDYEEGDIDLDQFDEILGGNRHDILKKQASIFMLNLAKSFDPFEFDPLTTEICVHFTGTEGQAASDLWKQQRLFRVTATSFLEFSRNPSGFIRKFWNGSPDLSHLESIQYGKKHEKDAIEAVTIAKDIEIEWNKPAGVVTQRRETTRNDENENRSKNCKIFS